MFAAWHWRQAPAGRARSRADSSWSNSVDVTALLVELEREPVAGEDRLEVRVGLELAERLAAAEARALRRRCAGRPSSRRLICRARLGAQHLRHRLSGRSQAMGSSMIGGKPAMPRVPRPADPDNQELRARPSTTRDQVTSRIPKGRASNALTASGAAPPRGSRHTSTRARRVQRATTSTSAPSTGSPSPSAQWPPAAWPAASSGSADRSASSTSRATSTRSSRPRPSRQAATRPTASWSRRPSWRPQTAAPTPVESAACRSV